MNEPDLERFETELRRLAPAAPPAELMTRLSAAVEKTAASSRPAQGLGTQERSRPSWQGWLRWLAPACGAAAVILVIGFWWATSQPPLSQTSDPVLTADQIEVDQQLIAAFDTVAQLPDGEPVRFRCREWEDAVIVRDTTRGIVIERRTPRLEVVPVRLEIY